MSRTISYRNCQFCGKGFEFCPGFQEKKWEEFFCCKECYRNYQAQEAALSWENEVKNCPECDPDYNKIKTCSDCKWFQTGDYYDKNVGECSKLIKSYFRKSGWTACKSELGRTKD